MKTLKLFNAVIADGSLTAMDAYVSEDGYIIEPKALWAKDAIISYYQKEKLSGKELNSTFHKSWATIKNSSRLELLIHQIHHYISTYGSNFQDEVYIPDEVLSLPDIKLKYKVIRALSSHDMTVKCLDLLKSGIALTPETIDDILSVLTDDCSYTFTGTENIRNKEAIVKVADLYGVYPNNATEFLRYVVFKATGETLLIKNKVLIDKIKASGFYVEPLFVKYGVVRLAEIFNRFKPLFLAFKNRQNTGVINKIAKLSKKYHKPLVVNPLNTVTSEYLTQDQLHWLDNATPYALMKAIHACQTRLNTFYVKDEGNGTFLYKVRNGKSYVKDNQPLYVSVVENNLSFILDFISKKFNANGIKVHIPTGVEYALPTSEKMYVGNIPMGTKFYGKNLAVGIYWENEWGARDLDLSALNIDGKVGWNSTYNQRNGMLMYSGDMTYAPSGAVEYLYASDNLDNSSLVQCNVFNGDSNAGYKIIVGKGDDITYNYMMNPNNLFLDVKTKAIQKQTIIGMVLPKTDKKSLSFVLMNFGAGNLRVSGAGRIADMSIKAVHNEWMNPFSFNDLLIYMGAEFVPKEEADVDLSLDSLEKDSFTKFFKLNK